jgi:uncharacterized protein (TIGR01777 family)
LVGAALGIALARQGHRLRHDCRDPAAVRKATAFPCRLFGWNDIPSAVAGAEVVVHLAGEPVADKAWTAAQKRAIRDSRVETTAKLVAAIVAAPPADRPRRFIQASAIGFYGDRGDEWLGEDSAPGNDFLSDVCREWEGATVPLAKARVPTTIVRIGVVLAREGGFLPRLSSMATSFLGDIPGDGRQWFSWIHLRDLVRLLATIVAASIEEDGDGDTAAWDGAFNAVAPHPVRFADFNRALTEHLRVRRGLKIPVPLLKLVLGARTELAVVSQRVSAQKLADRGFRFDIPRLGPALADILPQPEAPRASYLVAKQWLPRPPAELWPFFQDETNLELLTPPSVRFKTQGKSTANLAAGTDIDYRLRIRGVPCRWRTRITEWEPGVRFVDEQRRGPYAIWRHTHEFEPLAGGTLMTDTVAYRLPLLPAGGLLAGALVNSDVRKIFAYRRQQAARIFGENGSEP